MSSINIQSSRPLSGNANVILIESTGHGLETGDIILISGHSVRDSFNSANTYYQSDLIGKNNRVAKRDDNSFTISLGQFWPVNTSGTGGSFEIISRAVADLRITIVSLANRPGTNMVRIFYNSVNRARFFPDGTVSNNFGIRTFQSRRRDVSTQTEEDWVTIGALFNSSVYTPDINFRQFPEPFDPDYEYQFRVLQDFKGEVSTSDPVGFGNPAEEDGWWNPPAINALGTATSVTPTKIDATPRRASSINLSWTLPDSPFQKLVVEYQSFIDSEWTSWEPVPTGSLFTNKELWLGIVLPPDIDHRFRVVLSTQKDFNYRGVQSTESSESSPIQTDEIDAPENLAFLRDSFSLEYQLTWDRVNGAGEYDIFVKVGAGAFELEGTVQQVTNNVLNPTRFSGTLSTDGEHEFRVVAKQSVGDQEEASDDLEVDVDSPITVDKPLDVFVDQGETDPPWDGWTSVVRWDNQQDNHTKNVVEFRQDGAGAWSVAGETDANEDSFDVSHFEGGKTYQFRVKAVAETLVNGDTESIIETSDPTEIYDFPKLREPVDLTVDFFDDGTPSGYQLNWANQQENHSNNLVQKRLFSESEWSTVETLDPDSTAFFHEEASPLAAFFRIVAVTESSDAPSAHTVVLPSLVGLYWSVHNRYGYTQSQMLELGIDDSGEPLFYTHLVFAENPFPFLDGNGFPVGDFWIEDGFFMPDVLFNLVPGDLTIGPPLEPPGAIEAENIPTSKGLYWARRTDDTSWTFAINITGVTPFLRGNAIPSDRISSPEYFQQIRADDWVWGPEISVPDYFKP